MNEWNFTCPENITGLRLPFLGSSQLLMNLSQVPHSEASRNPLSPAEDKMTWKKRLRYKSPFAAKKTKLFSSIQKIGSAKSQFLLCSVSQSTAFRFLCHRVRS